MKVMATISREIDRYEMLVGESKKVIVLCSKCMKEFKEETTELPARVGYNSSFINTSTKFKGASVIEGKPCIVCEALRYD